jgi:hypothetical protein
MICLVVFSYCLLGLISLDLSGTIGKLSPIQFSAYNNRYLVNLLDITHVSKASPFQLQFTFYVILFLLFVAYAWGILIFYRRHDKGLFSILSLALLVTVLLIIIPPLVSKDLFSYIYYGKIGAVYKSNPYIITPQKFPYDQLLAFTGLSWKNTAVVYGPLFTYLSMFLTWISGESITANIYAYKTAMALANIANIVLIWYLLGKIAPRRQRFGTMLYAWNPLVLIHAVGGGHNDVLMMTFALIALVFFFKEKEYTGFIFLCLSSMVKYITIILVISYVIYALSRRTNWRDRFRELAVYASIFVIIACLLMLPFWGGLETLRSFRNNFQLYTYYTPSGWLTAGTTWVLHNVFRLSADLSSSLGSMLVKLVLGLLFFVVLVFISLRCRSKFDLPHCFFLITLAFLLYINFYQPWYMLWLLPFLCLRPWDRLSQYSLGLGTFTLIFAGIRPY